MSVCLYYFADFSMENATWQAARAIRTGQLQQAQGAYSGAVTNADRQKAFKKAFCDKAFLFPDCTTKVVVIVQSNTGFGGITQPNCASNGVVISDAAAAFNTGAASSVVLVTVCYPWDFGGKLPMFNLGQPARTARSSCRPRPPSAPSPTTDGLNARPTSIRNQSISDQTREPPCRPFR